MKLKTIVLIVILVSVGIYFINLTSSEIFGYDNPNLPSLQPVDRTFIGNFSWDGTCLNGGVEIKAGTICGQRLQILNISNLNITKQNLTIIDNAFFNGRVGIGTTTPTSALDIDGIFTIRPTSSISTIRTNSGESRLDFITNRGTSTFSSFTFFADGGTNRALDILQNGNVLIPTGDFIVDTNTLFVDESTNRVGIGTATPQNLLNVIGNVNFTQNLTVDDNNGFPSLFVDSVINSVGIATTSPLKDGITIFDSTPSYHFEQSGASVDESRWKLFVFNGDFFLRAVNDANNDGENVFAISRTGINVDSVGFGFGNFAVQTDALFVEESSGDVGIGFLNPTTRLDIDANSNTDGIRIHGATVGVEVGDIYVGNTGNFVFSTAVGSDNGAYIDIRGEDDLLGLIIRDSSGAGLGVFSNFYVVDTTTDILNMNVNSFRNIAGLVITANEDIGIKTFTPSSELEVNGSVTLTKDEDKLFFGASQDISLTMDGTSFNITDEVGSIDFFINGFTNVTFDNDVTIDGTLFGGSSVKIAGINITNNNFSQMEDLNSSLNFLIQNINTGENASAVISAGNDGGGKMSIGIGSSNFMIGETNYNNVTALFSRARGKMVFANFFNQMFVWLINPSDDNDASNLKEVMRLDENGLNVTGNITSENVFITQYHFAHTNETIPLNTASVWQNVTFTEEITDIQKGISHIHDDDTNQTFTVSKSGIYKITYHYDMIDTSASSSDINVAGRTVFINGTEISGSVFETDILKKDIEVELVNTFLVSLKANEGLIFQFIADDSDVQISTHADFGDNPESATVIIQKIANL